ncbi:hypothetical protein [Bacteroides sp. UBA939]|uniref:hypothetical protein n=1 Tax=Bacteroides sp. UBA939 TaxID=1946092 RepID=UPI0025C474A7|nr:hypothetical protein [Bacteroides sp. UBA939]
MKATTQDQKRAESLLQRKGIRLHNIQSFSFMKRSHEAPRESNLKVKDKYGAGILILHLKQGDQRATYIRPFQHPSSIIRYLISQSIPFENYVHRERTAEEIQETIYRRPSLYMFYFFVLFIAFMAFGFQAIMLGTWWAHILGIISFGLGIYFIQMLMTRFCYLKVDNKDLSIYSVGREIKYSYEDLLKVNFDFAREQAFTHIMEILDKDYHYRLYYIGRVSRRTLNEIAEVLQSAGVDATCSLNENKRFYHDIRH